MRHQYRLFWLSTLLIQGVLLLLLTPPYPSLLFVDGLSQSSTFSATSSTGTSSATTTTKKVNNNVGRRTLQPRRDFFSSIATTTTAVVVAVAAVPPPAWSRAPGSKNLDEAIDQIRDAAKDLKTLQKNWDMYAVIDSEGRSVGDATVLARRILGGVAPLAGDSAIAVAKATPLYRIDGAFAAVRKAAIAGDDGPDWISNLDLLAFEEVSERIQFALQKADGDFYSVAFASKGTKQIQGIFNEAKGQVDQGIVDFETIMGLLKEAGAPGL